MGKKMYVGVDNVARKVKKQYIGVDGVARKVKKVYVGVDNVARLAWSGGELGYHGYLSGLDRGMISNAGASVGDYAIFGGGVTLLSGHSSYYKNSTVAYNKSLTKSTPAATTTSRMQLSATSVGDYAIFGPGATWTNTYTISTTVDFYNSSLTHTTDELYRARYNAAASNGEYALFAGGCITAINGSYSGGSAVSAVYAYDTSLTKTTPANLVSGLFQLAGANAGTSMVFGGGCCLTINSSSAWVPCGSGSYVTGYDASLTKSSLTGLGIGSSSTVYEYPSATSLGKHALIFTGIGIAFYDQSLTRTGSISITTTQYYYHYSAAATIGQYALFAGGTTYSGNNLYRESTTKVFVLDESLTLITTPANLSAARSMHAAATVDNYAIFAGGKYHKTNTTGGNGLTSVEAFKIKD